MKNVQKACGNVDETDTIQDASKDKTEPTSSQLMYKQHKTRVNEYQKWKKQHELKQKKKPSYKGRLVITDRLTFFT